MSSFYTIIPGKIQGIKTSKKTYINCTNLVKILFKALLLGGSIYFTNFVFKQCISENTLENTIALGSIFATFGSAIVAVASLFCNDFYVRFADNVLVLQNDLLKDEKWTRWTFIKRKSKTRLLDSGNFIQELHNAQIEFQLGSHCIAISIPTVRADFDDLPVGRLFFKMKRYGKQYETNLCNHATDEDTNAYFLWDCVYDIYMQIVLYKICTALIWLGCSLIFTSILFSFLYIYI